ASNCLITCCTKTERTMIPLPSITIWCASCLCFVPSQDRSRTRSEHEDDKHFIIHFAVCVVRLRPIDTEIGIAERRGVSIDGRRLYPTVRRDQRLQRRRFHRPPRRDSRPQRVRNGEL